MKNIWMNSWTKKILIVVVTLGLPALVACGSSSSVPNVNGPLSGAGLAACSYGSVNFGNGCATANPQTWASTCAYSGGSVITSSDGTTVCRMTIQSSQQGQGPVAEMGPSGGAGIPIGSLMPGDDVSVTANGHWGNNACNFNLCWNTSCICSCHDTGESTNAATGLYASAGGTVVPVQPSANFRVGSYNTSLNVGFNAPSMTCFELNLQVTVIRCQDINGLTHPCQ